MGAATFTNYQSGTSVEDCFKDAVANALHWHGHGGYTGTIAEKDSYTIISDQGMPYQQAVALADGMLSERNDTVDDKWGPAGAIRVKQRVSKHHARMAGWLFFGWASE
jgi:hypothetical protein